MVEPIATLFSLNSQSTMNSGLRHTNKSRIWESHETEDCYGKDIPFATYVQRMSYLNILKARFARLATSMYRGIIKQSSAPSYTPLKKKQRQRLQDEGQMLPLGVQDVDPPVTSMPDQVKSVQDPSPQRT